MPLRDAVRLTRRLRPHSVGRLPELSGYDFARIVRREQRDAIRLVAISGYAQPEDIQRSLEAGFDAHVAKPAQPAEIARLLRA